MLIDEFFVNLCYCYVVEKNREEFFMKKRLMSQEFEKLNKALCGGWNGTFLVGGGAIVE